MLSKTFNAYGRTASLPYPSINSLANSLDSFMGFWFLCITCPPHIVTICFGLSLISGEVIRTNIVKFFVDCLLSEEFNVTENLYSNISPSLVSMSEYLMETEANLRFLYVHSFAISCSAYSNLEGVAFIKTASHLTSLIPSLVRSLKRS